MEGKALSDVPAVLGYGLEVLGSGLNMLGAGLEVLGACLLGGVLGTLMAPQERQTIAPAETLAAQL